MTMKSIRLSRDLEHRLTAAARARGISESEFIRQAVLKQIEEVLGRPTLFDQLGDVIGLGELGEERASQSEKAFGELLRQRSSE